MRKFFILLILIFIGSTPEIHADEPAQAGSIVDMAGRINARESSGQTRYLETGSPVYMGDSIKTGREEWLQLKFSDATLFTIGERSEIVIDEFLYEPAGHKGKIDIAVEGSFRFLTGKIVKQDPEKFQVNTTFGHIGVRGTQVIGNADKKETFIVLEKPDDPEHNSGHAILFNDTDGQRHETHLTEFDFGSRVGKDGIPSEAFKVPEKELKKLRKKLEKPAENMLDPFDTVDSLTSNNNENKDLPHPLAEDHDNYSH